MFRGRLVGCWVGRKRCFSHMDCTRRWCKWREVGGDCYLESELSRQKCSDVDRNNLGGKLFNDATRQEFITDFVDEYKRTIEGLAPRRVFVISILPRNLETDNPHTNDYIKELNFALSQMVETLNYGVFLDVYDDFAHEDKMNMNYSLDGLHLNDLGYNILNVRLSKEL